MAPRIVVRVARKVSRILTEQEVPHALAGALAVGVHGFSRMTEHVNFIIPRGSREAIEQFGPVTPVLSPLKGIAVTVDRVGVAFLFVSRPLHRRDLSSAADRAGLPILGLEALVGLKVGTGHSTDILDIIELLKRGEISVPDVSRRLSGCGLEQFRSLVAIADLEKRGNPKEGRRLLVEMLAKSAGSR